MRPVLCRYPKTSFDASVGMSVISVGVASPARSSVKVQDALSGSLESCRRVRVRRAKQMKDKVLTWTSKVDIFNSVLVAICDAAWANLPGDRSTHAHLVLMMPKEVMVEQDMMEKKKGVRFVAANGEEMNYYGRREIKFVPREEVFAGRT